MDWMDGCMEGCENIGVDWDPLLVMVSSEC